MLDKDTLHRLYIVEGKSTHEIATIAGVQHQAVSTWLRKHGIPARKGKGSRTTEPSLDKETLYGLYVLERMTTTEIAALVGMKSDQTISNWLRKYDIPLRDVREAQRAVKPEKELLHDLYEVQQLSIDTIARQIGSSEASISRYLQQHGIPTRDKSAHLAGWNKGIPLPDWQRKILSESAKARTGEKAPRYGAKLSKETRKQIANSLKGKYRQHLHPNWKNGGITKYRMIVQGQFEYKDWRNAVYERDNYTCQMCKKPSNGDIQAHHIHRVIDCPERMLDVTNGITLCVKCHRSIHYKEQQYVAQFEAITHPPTP